MKFLKHHHEAILAAFVSCSKSKDEFSFIKRKGRIITQHNHTKSTFAYIQKKETTVDHITKEWTDIFLTQNR